MKKIWHILHFRRVFCCSYQWAQFDTILRCWYKTVPPVNMKPFLWAKGNTQYPTRRTMIWHLEFFFSLHLRLPESYTPWLSAQGGVISRLLPHKIELSNLYSPGTSYTQLIEVLYPAIEYTRAQCEVPRFNIPARWKSSQRHFCHSVFPLLQRKKVTVKVWDVKYIAGVPS